MSVEKLLWENDATALAAFVRRGEVSAEELVEASIERAERTHGSINAVIVRLFDRARETAKSFDTSALFAGVPIAIKDLAVSVNGVPRHGGSNVPPFVPDYDSELVSRYRAAGFIPIATVSTPEFGLRLVTETEKFGITRNPWNTDHVTGGSSGGSAAVVAAGVVPIAHASDGGGSIRVPSACTGLVGMKPSRGRVPLTPDASEDWFGFVVQHAVTRSVRDSAAMLDLSSRHDPISPFMAREPNGTFSAAAKTPREGMLIGVYRGSPLGLEVSLETYKALDTAIELACEAGHTVEEIDLPMANRDFFVDFGKVVGAGFAGSMRMEAERCGRSVLGDLERASRILARYGERKSAGETTAALLRLQARARELLAQTNQYDAVFMPVIAHQPLPCSGMDPQGFDLYAEKMIDALRLTWLLEFEQFFHQLLDQSFWFTHWPAIQNVTGQPAIALPVHITSDGLPLGIQAVGRIGDEETLYSLAGQLEEISGWLKRRASLDIPT